MKKFLINFFTKNKWETVFTGLVKNRSKDGKLILQVERTKNLYRVLVYGGGVTEQIPLYKLIKTFPEVLPILELENINIE